MGRRKFWSLRLREGEWLEGQLGELVGVIRRHLLSHKRGLKEEGRGTWSRHVRACAVHVALGPFGLGLAGLAHWLAWPIGPPSSFFLFLILISLVSFDLELRN
jgi:hypothetical protein